MILIGIDQGIANFGFAVLDIDETSSKIDENSVKILGSGLIKTHSKDPLGRRLITIRTKMESLIKEYQPSMLGCEKLFYNAPTGGRNKSLAMMHVNMATGMLHILSVENGMMIGEYPPTTVKKMITGNGRASKEEISQSIEKYLTKQVKSEHEVDAVAIGITAFLKQREEELKGVKDKGSAKKAKTRKKGA